MTAINHPSSEHEPFIASPSMIDRDMPPGERTKILRLRGRRFIERALHLHTPQATRNLHNGHSYPLLYMIDKGLTLFNNSGAVKADMFQRMNLFFTSDLTATAIGEQAQENKVMSGKEVSAERIGLRWLITRTTANNEARQWFLHGIATVQNLSVESLPDPDSSAVLYEHITNGNGESIDRLHETARSNVVDLLQSMTRNDPILLEAMMCHFMDTERPPTMEQRRLIAKPLALMKRHYVEFAQANRYKRTYPAPERRDPGHRLYVSLLGAREQTTRPVSRAEHAAKTKTDRDAVNKLDTIGLWYMLRWQFLVPPVKQIYE